MTPARSGKRWATRAGAVLVAAVAGGALAACQPTSDSAVMPDRYVEAPIVDAAARSAYGDGAEAAYHHVADFLMDQSFAKPLLDPAHSAPTQQELTKGIVEAMTPETGAAWSTLVSQTRSGDLEARETVRLLRFNGSLLPDAVLPERPVSWQTVTEGEVTLGAAAATAAEGAAAGTAVGAAAARPLVISLVQDAGITLTSRNVPQDIELTKSLTLTVVPSTAGSPDWLISEFEGDLDVEVNGASQGG